MKKILALLLCIAMLACVLAGCGDNSAKADTAADMILDDMADNLKGTILK